MAVFRFQSEWGVICVEAPSRELADRQFAELKYRLTAANDEIARAFTDTYSHLEHEEQQGKQWPVH